MVISNIEPQLQIEKYLGYVTHALNTFEAKVFSHLIELPDIKLPQLNHRERKAISSITYRKAYGEAEDFSKDVEGFYNCVPSKDLEREAINPVTTSKWLKSKAYQEELKLKQFKEGARAIIKSVTRKDDIRIYRSNITGRQYLYRLPDGSFGLNKIEIYQLELVEQYQLQHGKKTMRHTLNDYQRGVDKLLVEQIRDKLINRIHEQLIKDLVTSAIKLDEIQKAEDNARISIDQALGIHNEPFLI